MPAQTASATPVIAEASAISDTIAWLKMMPSATDLQLVVDRLSAKNGESHDDTEWTLPRLKSVLIEARGELGRPAMLRMLAEIEEAEVEAPNYLPEYLNEESASITEPEPEAEVEAEIEAGAPAKTTTTKKRTASKGSANSKNGSKSATTTKKPRAAKTTD